jgi:hypothetical protein
MEELARLRVALDWEAALSDLRSLALRIASEIRAFGLERRQADEFSRRALTIVGEASRDPVCRWILAPHAEAASEARFVGVLSGGVRTVQVDRVFRAGAAPRAVGDDCWWIVDYKTAHEDGVEASEFLPRLRDLFAPQLEAYAAVLRNLHGSNARICAGLYYPRLLQFDWWEM